MAFLPVKIGNGCLEFSEWNLGCLTGLLIANTHHIKEVPPNMSSSISTAIILPIEFSVVGALDGFYLFVKLGHLVGFETVFESKGYLTFV